MKYWPDYDIHEPKVAPGSERLCEGLGPFRPNVAALILRPNIAHGLEILLGERADTPGSWQWPQGGLEPNETPEACLRREMQEEVGLTDFHIQGHFPFMLRYRFPLRLGKKYAPRLGQDQLFYVISLKEGFEPELANASDKEFSQLLWVPLSQAGEKPVWFKAGVYEAALAELGKWLTVF